jgi:hypothetical protein
MSISDLAVSISERIQSEKRTQTSYISKDTFMDWSKEVVEPPQDVTIFEVYKYFVNIASPIPGVAQAAPNKAEAAAEDEAGTVEVYEVAVWDLKNLGKCWLGAVLRAHSIIFSVVSA